MKKYGISCLAYEGPSALKFNKYLPVFPLVVLNLHGYSVILQVILYMR